MQLQNHSTRSATRDFVAFLEFHFPQLNALGPLVPVSFLLGSKYCHWDSFEGYSSPYCPFNPKDRDWSFFATIYAIMPVHRAFPHVLRSRSTGICDPDFTSLVTLSTQSHASALPFRSAYVLMLPVWSLDRAGLYSPDIPAGIYGSIMAQGIAIVVLNSRGSS